MKQLIDIYVKKGTHIDFLLYLTLALIVQDNKFANKILKDRPKLIKALKNNGWIRIINKVINPTNKTLTLLEPDKSEFTKLINKFNEFKSKYRNINRKSKLTSSNKSNLTARLKDYDIDYIIDVIEMKFKKWSNSSMENYLRLETLLNNTKFESYSDEYEIYKKEENNSLHNFE